MDQYILLGVLGGLLAVDDRAGWQSLLAQPVFTGLLAGFLVGEIQSGIATGLLLEFVWLSILPMRGTRRPDHVVGSVVGAGTTCLLIHNTGDPRFVFLTAIGVFMGLLTSVVSVWISRPFFEWREAKLSSLEYSSTAFTLARLRWIHLGNTVAIFMVKSVMVFVLLLLAVRLGARITLSMNESVISAARYWDFLLPVMGAAALIQIYWHKYSIRFLFLSMSLISIVLWIR